MSCAYSQLVLHSNSDECESITTPYSTSRPVQAVHKSTNTDMYLECAMDSLLLGSSRRNFFWLLVGIVIHCQSVEADLLTTPNFFNFFVTHSFKLYPATCSLFFSSIRSCSQIISMAGGSPDHSRIETIQYRLLPRTGTRLQQFVYSTQWIPFTSPVFVLYLPAFLLYLNHIDDR